MGRSALRRQRSGHFPACQAVPHRHLEGRRVGACGASGDQKLSAAQRLEHVQRVILDELTWAEQQAKQPGADRAALSDVIIKLSGEVRAQLRLEHDISRTLIDLRVVREFQRTVFEAISEESPETARRIVAKLKAQRALRHSVDLPTLDNTGDLDVA